MNNDIERNDDFFDWDDPSEITVILDPVERGSDNYNGTVRISCLNYETQEFVERDVPVSNMNEVFLVLTSLPDPTNEFIDSQATQKDKDVVSPGTGEQVNVVPESQPDENRNEGSILPASGNDDLLIDVDSCVQEVVNELEAIMNQEVNDDNQDSVSESESDVDQDQNKTGYDNWKTYEFEKEFNVIGEHYLDQQDAIRMKGAEPDNVDTQEVKSRVFFVLAIGVTVDSCTSAMLCAKHELQAEGYKCEWLEERDIHRLGHPKKDEVFVLDPFKGAGYLWLKSRQKNRKDFFILGPHAVQSLMRHTGFPNEPFRPLYTFCMKGINVVISNCIENERADMEDKISKMGGVVTACNNDIDLDLDPRVTHVISLSMRDPVSTKAGNARVPVQETSWVQDVWIMCTHEYIHPTHAADYMFSSDRCKALKGIYVHVGEYGGPGTERLIKEKVADNGGIVIEKADRVEDHADVIVSRVVHNSTVPTVVNNWMEMCILEGHAIGFRNFLTVNHPNSLTPQDQFIQALRADRLNRRRLIFQPAFVILANFIPPRMKHLFKQLMNLGNVEIAEGFTDSVTHVVVDTEYGIIQPSSDYLYGLICNKIIVTTDWIKECVRQERMLPRKYEIEYDTALSGSSYPFNGQAKPAIPKIFKEMVFQFQCYSDGILGGIPVRIWTDIVEKLGGVVVPFEAERHCRITIKVVDRSFDIFSVQGQEFQNCKATIEKNVEWIIRCVINHKIMP